MKKWENWEIELLEFYKKQPTTIGIVASLLNRTKEEVTEKMSDIA